MRDGFVAKAAPTTEYHLSINTLLKKFEIRISLLRRIKGNLALKVVDSIFIVKPIGLKCCFQLTGYDLYSIK